MANFRYLMGWLVELISGGFAWFSLGGKIKLVLGIVLFFLIVVVGAVLLTERIDDDPSFAVVEAATEVPALRSHAAALAAALIEREVDTHAWVANDPIFLPGHWLDNMPNYQQGIIYALSRFAVQLSDQIGRARGSSQVDPDLDQAAGFLKYPGNVWMFNPQTSLMPVASSESQYRAAQRALLNYNRRLGEGKAVFDPRSDNLINTLDSIAGDLGSQSAIIEQHLRSRPFWLIDTVADDVFYATKGRLYAYGLLLREIGRDYQTLIKERDLTQVWANMLNSFNEAIVLRPWVVISAAPDAQFLPSHLATQGFYVLRARTNLREITNILSK
jgi:hypothetical protein